jgi:hypothetical protein
MLEIVKYIPSSALDGSPSYNQIRLACRKSGINSMYMHYTRKIFASHLRNEGIQPEIIDMLQGIAINPNTPLSGSKAFIQRGYYQSS